jgi:hypothetical protein
MNNTGNAKPTMGSFVDVKCLFATKARTTLAKPFFALSSVSPFCAVRDHVGYGMFCHNLS